MKSIAGRIRLPRKVMFIVAGAMVLCGASGAFALYIGKETLLGKKVAEKSLSGVACTTVQTLKLRRNGQRWIRKYVNTASDDGLDRVTTALRVTGVLAKAEKADFYHVVVLDAAGPRDRAHFRGAAIGAEVLFAPQPQNVPGMTAAFVAKYTDGKANTAGLFHGPEIVMPLETIKTALTVMDDKSDCIDPTVEIGEPGSESAHKSLPGDEEIQPGHEAAAKHGKAADGAHGKEPAEAGHGEKPEAGTEEGGGLFASIKAMIFGADPAAEAGKAETAPDHEGEHDLPVAPVAFEAEETPVAADHAADKPAH